MTDQERYQRAYEYAAKKHAGQYRIGGKPYMTHPEAVAEALRAQGYDVDYQITGLFHDLLEDTDASETEIEALGGREVLEAVRLLTKRPLTKKYWYPRVPRQQAGRDTKPDTLISSPEPFTGVKPRAMSRPSTAYRAERSAPSPGVNSSCFPSRRKRTDTSGWDRAVRCTATKTAAPSAASFFMNFSRAGVL